MKNIFGITILVGGLVLNAQNSLAESQVKRLDQSFQAVNDKTQRLITHLKMVDERIEVEISELINMLKRFEDSKDSRDRILGNKQKLIKDLKSSIKIYSEYRKKLANDLKLTNKRFRSEDFRKFLDFLDKKMLTRLEQIVKITQSLDTYKEHYDFSNSHFRNARKNAKDADKERGRLIDDINKGIKNLSDERNKLEKYFSKPNPNRSLSEISQEISAINQKIKALEHSIQEIMYGPKKKGQKISKDGARTIEKQVREKTHRLNADFQTMNRGLNQLYLALQNLKRSEDTLHKAESHLKPIENTVPKTND
jgi:predicted  nucleic acid-binding Zn-ribbon protein